MKGVGITVICIKQDLLGTLKVSESYLITDSYHGRNSLSFELSGIKNRMFPSDFFVTFDEYRRLKILKIKERIYLK